MQVAMFLAQQGFDTVANITGGINAWSSQVDPSVPTY
jgi:rhodanese-related sulfurtransferase